MQKYIISATVTSCLMVSNLMAIDYNEALNLIQNKSFKVIYGPYGFDCKDANFSESGIAINGENTITLQDDGTLKDNSQGQATIDGFSWTIIDYDSNGFILKRTDELDCENCGKASLVSYDVNETSFLVSEKSISYEIGNYFIVKSSDIPAFSEYDQYAALNPSGYTSWYDYLTATNGKINQYDTEGLYDLNTMTQDFGFGPSPIIIDQNNTRLFIKSCTPMGDQREETYILENNHIMSQIFDTNYYVWEKPDSYIEPIVDSNTSDVNVTQNNVDIFYPNGWSLSGVGKDENLSVSNIKCQNGNLTSMWKYKNNQWNLYVPSNIDYGYTTFNTLNNRDGFWVNCQ